MPTVRRMALPVLAVSLFLLSADAISSSTFARAQETAQADHKLQPFTLSSPNFRDGGPLPSSSEYGGGFGCNGEDIAPTLTWKNVPAQSSSFALVMNDVDAAVAGGFHHWIVYNIPATARMLQGNAPYTQGTNSLNIRTYFGPCPPATGEKHHYIFTLYALSTDHLQQDGLTYDGLIQAINGHVVGATTIVGTFRRVPPGTPAN
ncbi:MAG TPA: YbhB/YbcL family Raf kinase inhibitor-like protein [Ktedonobacteraceae bacterium]